MALKLPRTIRLDASDTLVFAHAAEPGEWAVSGAFRFWDTDPAALAGKERQAFRAGFLGIASFGWSTLVVVTPASAAEQAAAIDALAANLVRHCGAPDLAAARPAAEEELAFAASLCADHPDNTLIAVQRSVEAGEVRERFRTLHRRADRVTPSRAFVVVPDDTDEEAAETVDLAALAGGGRS